MRATLQQLGIIPSFNRPKTSNDNPYSESLFKTIKHIPNYPVRPFEDIDVAKSWVELFVEWYNNSHYHSGIGYVTPSQRHDGLDSKVLKQRQETYLKAREKNPNRWSGDIRNWAVKESVRLYGYRD